MYGCLVITNKGVGSSMNLPKTCRSQRIYKTSLTILVIERYSASAEEAEE
ncbi:hypothetical protein HanRHA438_Chr13g0589591 [Helianthus annuus]|nr:hypothetical protein HanRHA438_Chr13g0589591 [Helianthus annuus]